MNRLIIVGNGFDIAHGLPTSYRNFIDDYWASLASKFYNSESLYNDELIDVSLSFMRTAVVIAKQEIKEVKSFKDFKNFIDKYKTGHNPYQYEDKNACRLIFNNDFFEIINEKNSENWVDIETEYYSQLKIIIRLENQRSELLHNFNKEEIEKLNLEFDEVKKLLANYLRNIVEPNNKFSKDKKEEFINIFEDNYYEEGSIDSFFKEFPRSDLNELEKLFVKD